MVRQRDPSITVVNCVLGNHATGFVRCFNDSDPEDSNALWRVSRQARVALASNRRKTDSVRREGSIQLENLRNSRIFRLLYRYKRVSGGLIWPIVRTVEDFVADVAPRAVRAHVLPGRCEEVGRGCVFAVPVAAPQFIAVEVAGDPETSTDQRGIILDPGHFLRCQELLERPIVSTVEDFVADVAPRAVRAHVLPGRCEEVGRGCVFAVPVAAPQFIAVEERRITTRLGSLEPRLRDESIGSLLVRFGEDFRDTVSQVPASTFRILARSLRRSVGIQRNLGHWIRDFETKLQNPCLLNLDKGLLFQLLLLLRRTAGKTWRVRAYPSSTVLEDSRCRFSYASYTGEILLYTADFVGVPGGLCSPGRDRNPNPNPNPNSNPAQSQKRSEKWRRRRRRSSPAPFGCSRCSPDESEENNPNPNSNPVQSQKGSEKSRRRRMRRSSPASLGCSRCSPYESDSTVEAQLSARPWRKRNPNS
uniref:Uncharacterized protein n=1 Tax=Ananas comosus var. bracteatus TaxID=296719 RepID=A0A6V7NFM7_ANACO|nr:unnamed protein product [Ananas comosus var. bracteatus]